MLMYLEKMRKEKRTLRFLSPKPKELAHSLRQALAAAEEFPEFRHYGALRNDYVIRAKSDAAVADYIVITPVVEEAAKKMEKRGEFLNVITLPDVIAATIKERAGVETLVFPDANLSVEEKDILFDWTTQQGFNMIDSEEGGITLTTQAVLDFLLYKRSDA